MTAGRMIEVGQPTEGTLMHRLGPTEHGDLVAAEAHRLRRHAEAALAGVLGRPADAFEFVIASNGEVERLADLRTLEERIKKTLRDLGVDDDLRRAEIDLSLHLLGVAKVWPPGEALPIPAGAPTVILNADLISERADGEGEDVRAAILVILLHEMAHIARDHVSGTRQARRSVGQWDAEVEAQELAYLALDWLLAHEPALSPLVIGAQRFMHAIASRQSPQYRVFLTQSFAKTAMALTARVSRTWTLSPTEDASGVFEGYADGARRLIPAMKVEGPSAPTVGDTVWLIDTYDPAVSAWVQERNDLVETEAIQEWSSRYPRNRAGTLLGPLHVIDIHKTSDEPPLPGIEEQPPAMYLEVAAHAASVTEVPSLEALALRAVTNARLVPHVAPAGPPFGL